MTWIVHTECILILVMHVDFVHVGGDGGRCTEWKLNFGNVVDIIGRGWLGHDLTQTNFSDA